MKKKDNPEITSWESVMSKFRSDVEQIEQNTKSFMDTSFKKLRSAEGAFDLLCKFRNIQFRNIQSREAIKQQMEEKTTDILVQYEKEIEKVHAIFLAHKDNPPVTKNQPPVSKEMRHYQQALFAEWRESVNQLAMHHLKEHILIEVDGKLAVNFNTTLLVLIRESKYLDRMGFSVPETALNVTLQEEKYYECVESLTAMLEYHSSVLASLSPVEANLLATKGHPYSNLLTTKVADMCAVLNKGTGLFLLCIQKKAHIIKGVVDSISRAQVVQLGGSAAGAAAAAAGVAGDVPELQELYDEMERTRLKTIEELTAKYHQISPLLMKVEEEVVGTSTGRSPLMREYYAFWEGQAEDSNSYERRPPLFRVGAILSTPEMLCNMVRLGQDGAARSCLCEEHCREHTSVRARDIPLPCATLCRSVKSIAENTRQFVRWMDGTCIETPPQTVSEDEDAVVFSFYTDVVANPEVIRLMMTLTSKIQQVFGRINKYLRKQLRKQLRNQKPEAMDHG
ncbi:dynein heavy chain, N-terminal region 1-domain-containing protein [Pavlovales sp. CCMP2436]|nr:dynein heavy chain, N-terminal region 1-domain-containing protein [Pavlovales sp. CCMP2436]